MALRAIIIIADHAVTEALACVSQEADQPLPSPTPSWVRFDNFTPAILGVAGLITGPPRSPPCRLCLNL